MTMLASFYAAEGIVYAADSQITAAGGSPTSALPPQKKVLRVPGVGIADGLIGYFGLAQVRGQPMTEWLRRQFREWQGGSAEELAAFVAERLTQDLAARERKQVSGFHIGAFERRESTVVPTFVFLRNTSRFENGVHLDPGAFQWDEQLLGHYMAGVPLTRLRRALRDLQRQEGVPFWLRNGDILFFAPIWNGIQHGASLIVGQPGYQAPSTLDGWATFARTLITTTGQLYRVLYVGGAPLIGNKPIVETLQWP